MQKKEFMEELAKQENFKSQEEFNKVKHQLARKFKLPEVPKNAEILSTLSPKKREKIENILLSKPVRTISGVAPVAIMAAPIACPPQAQCTYCPGGPGSIFGNTPKSYTDGAPAVKRAIRNKYDPYLQVFNRLEQYLLLKHVPSKVELIIMGGTFPNFPKPYRDDFIKFAIKAMNDFSDEFYTPKGEFKEKKFKEFFLLPGDIDSKERELELQKRITKLKENNKETTVEKEQIKNEIKKIRCIALVIETRPDCSMESEINEMLRIGTTRVELGIQSLRDDVLKEIKRGHSVDETIKATQLLKDSLMKITYHMMLGLPLTDRKSDIDAYKELFSNPDFQPDSLKIYPCLVMAGTPLYEDFKKGKFKPVDTEEATERIIEIKKHIPEYCRIMRIQRDIPTYMTEAGVDKTNLRQLILEKLHKAKKQCRCIRCREPKNQEVSLDHIKTKIKKYKSSGGTELFISKEDIKNDILLGYARLRIPYKPFRKEITDKSAGIRELHVFGTALDLKNKPKVSSEAQHRGYGKELMLEAEKIAKEDYDSNKMVVISGMGVREYYKNVLSYKQDGPYVSKKL
ncbi:tRNA uridine(34) 5-carboxymethylaminomethyl modification radical SAM/GNAT enzyme Elp3 [Candidatus Woesearchaeota archaeon]|nr:tRNA uridine(34) 5-carboxymethylaminomethyl modification radical SAM/GNAT enzyme Elp3 [Candidatus Woesearchaeota archaeon]MBT6402456.1 tRNA uridine(34) 5-carboxymethylaminomethyl modification radical SAM/GNAT enzyme Elp3 [Candidatus Woesearchaeota archaeon]